MVDIGGADFAVAGDVGPLKERHVGVHVRLLHILRLEQHPHYELEFLYAATILVELFIRQKMLQSRAVEQLPELLRTEHLCCSLAACHIDVADDRAECTYRHQYVHDGANLTSVCLYPYYAHVTSPYPTVVAVTKQW